MRTNFAFWLLTFCSFQLSALAGQPSDSPDKEETTITTSAAAGRQIRFEVSEEPLEMSLFAADPKLLELKYVAIVRLESSSAPYRNSFSTTGGRQLYVEYHRLLSSGSRGFRLDDEDLARLVEELPDGIEHRDLLLSVLRDKPHQVRFDASAGRSTTSEIRVLAPTVEEARNLADAFVTLLDRRFARPLRQLHLKELEEIEQQLEDLPAELEKTQTELEAAQSQLEEATEISDESLTDLRTQQRMTAVDLASVKARIDACNKILERQLPAERIQQVETIKITAEIELVGLTARKAALEQLIAEGRSYAELRDKVATLQGPVRSIRDRIANAGLKHAQVKQDADTVAHFPLADNTVVIRPITWSTNPRF